MRQARIVKVWTISLPELEMKVLIGKRSVAIRRLLFVGRRCFLVGSRLASFPEWHLFLVGLDLPGNIGYVPASLLV